MKELIKVDGRDAYLQLPELRSPEEDKWMRRGACINKFPDLDFFSLGSATDRAECKRVCTACVVRQQCLDFAVQNDIQYGMWGGALPAERKAS